MMAMALAACGPRTNGAVSEVKPRDEATAESAYVASPSLTTAVRQAGGRITLTGRAQPGAHVRLATPAGDSIFAKADVAGVWRAVLPASGVMRLFGLSMSEGQRTVQAEGYLAIAPDGRAAQLRSGAGAVVLGVPPRTLRILAVDFDNLGEADKLRAAVVSGAAAPGATVSVVIDGVQRQAVADADGRFMALNEPLAAGVHTLETAQDGSRVRLLLPIVHAPPLTPGPFRAERTDLGWRIDWMTPGGGVQSTLLVDKAEGST